MGDSLFKSKDTSKLNLLGQQATSPIHTKDDDRQNEGSNNIISSANDISSTKQSTQSAVATEMTITNRFQRSIIKNKYIQMDSSQGDGSDDFQVKMTRLSFRDYANFFCEFFVRELKAKPLQAIITVSTIAILITFFGMVQSMIDLSPLVYLHMNEREVGEFDIAFYNSQLSDVNDIKSANLFLDFKSIKDRFCSESLQGCASRFQIIGQTNFKSQSVTSDVLLIDIATEQSIGFGRKVKLDQLIDNECYVGQQLYDILPQKIKSGKQPFELLLNLDMFMQVVPLLSPSDQSDPTQFRKHFLANIMYETLNEQGFHYSSAKDVITHFLGPQTSANQYQFLLNSFDFSRFFNITVPQNESQTQQQTEYAVCLGFSEFFISFPVKMNLNVKTVIPDSSGKYSEKLSHVIILDYKTQMSNIFSQISNSLVAEFLSRVKQQSLSHGIAFEYVRSDSVEYIERNLNAVLSKEFFDTNAILVEGIFKNKANVYLSEEAIKKEVQKVSERYVEQFGFKSRAKIAFPLAIAQIQSLKQKQIIDNSSDSSLILLVALSSIVIYSVSHSAIKGKVQEYGILRILGYSMKDLIRQVIVKTSVFFVIPSVILALIVNEFVSFLVLKYFDNLLTFNGQIVAPNQNKFLISCLFLGVGLPLFCNIYPFKSFLDKQVLSQALNIHQRAIQKSKIVIQKLENYGVSFYGMVNAIILITVGVVSYYFAPYAFVMKKMGLFLAIINMMFLLVNGGVGLLLNIIQRKLEQLWIVFLIRFVRKQDKILLGPIMNNFKNNENRMKKLGMIIMMTFSFFISIGSSVHSQVKMGQNLLKQSIGSDYLLENTYVLGCLDEHALTQTLEEFKLIYPDVIQSYSFASKLISQLEGFLTRGRVHNFIDVSSSWNVIGISSDFYDSIYSDLFIPDLVQPSRETPSSALYYQNGTSIGAYNASDTITSKDQYKVLTEIKLKELVDEGTLIEHSKEQDIRLYISSKERSKFALDFDSYIEMDLGYTRYKVKLAGSGRKVPGFKSFSENVLISMSEEQIAFVSMEQMHHIIKTSLYIAGFSKQEYENIMSRFPKNLTFEIPKDMLFVKLREDVNILEEDKLALKARISEQSQSNKSPNNSQGVSYVDFYDTNLMLNSLQNLVRFWNILFYLISGFIVLLSYYILTITFKSNVQDNLHTIKIYKSIGLSHVNVTKIFLYEGLSVMIVNGLTGIFVGFFLSFMIQNQVSVFLEMPMDMSVIPVSLTILLFVGCTFIAAFTSFSEIRSIMHLQVSQIDI